MRFLLLLAGVLILAPAMPARAAPPAGALACSGCHPAAPGLASPVPRLIGLASAEIVLAMLEFRAGKRSGTIMERIAKGFSDDEIQAIAEWYAKQR